MIFKRGKIYWYEFRLRGKRIQKSTRQTNADEARNAESAARMRLVKGVNGTETPEPRIVPSLEQFKSTFMEWVRSDKKSPGTQVFYENCYRRLCEFKPFAKARLDQIDEGIVEDFKLWVIGKGITQITCNRYLSTLRKALRYAWRRRRLIDRMPAIELYSDERVREFVFTESQYREWLEAAREPLRSASVLAHDGGFCDARRNQRSRAGHAGFHAAPVRPRAAQRSGPARGRLHQGHPGPARRRDRARRQRQPDRPAAGEAQCRHSLRDARPRAEVAVRVPGQFDAAFHARTEPARRDRRDRRRRRLPELPGRLRRRREARRPRAS